MPCKKICHKNGLTPPAAGCSNDKGVQFNKQFAAMILCRRCFSDTANSDRQACGHHGVTVVQLPTSCMLHHLQPLVTVSDWQYP